jgi:starch phosphorylase
MGSPFKRLFDEYFPDWRKNPKALLDIDLIPDNVLMDAHQNRKNYLLGYVNSQLGKTLDAETLTIGFARRAATYKRAQLLFHDMEKFEYIGRKEIQIIFSGKAHPNDKEGKELIRQIVEKSKMMFGKVKIVFLENYNMWLGRMITSGVDVWLNTPLRPNEASGTSGMKATLNGVPNLSVLDGWWAEGCEDGINGWAVGDPNIPNDENDAKHLYRVLENEVIPIFYENRSKWISIMKASIKTGVNFTAHRMITEYNKVYYQGVKNESN